ncbi:MAG: GH3 family domain-containing protein [Bacteroidota bacterium]
MAVIGEIIKKSVEIVDKIVGDPDPVQAQQEVLKELLEKASHTSFGLYYNFKSILKSKDLTKSFSEEVPFFNYDQMYTSWWKKVIDGVPDITWPGKVKYFALSSGTTSDKKRIPVTREMLASIRKAALYQIKGVSDFDLPSSFFEKEILMFGSSTNLKNNSGRLEGEISGISASQLPFWFEGYYRPGKEISSIDDWDKRVEALAKEAPKWDIGSISGIPSWIELMLKKVMEYHDLKSIHDIWPNFLVYTSGGVAFEPYRKSFEKITSKPIIVIDTYLASEGYLATQIRKETDAMALITNNGVYFEFVPFTPENLHDDGSIKQGAPSLKINQVEEGVEYVLVISTVAGAWRYMIGDTIVFTDKKRAEIKITGRTKHFLNVVGSQLSVIQMNNAMEELQKQYDLEIKEFTVAAIQEDDEYIHKWYLGIDGEKTRDEDEVARSLDEILKENNKNYKVARSKALKGIKVHVVPSGLFQQWTEQTKQKGGQVKVPRVMNEKDFKKWESFVKHH